MTPLSLLLSILAGLGPLQESYDAPRIDRGPAIDGRLDDRVWTAASWTGDFVDIRGPEGGSSPTFRTPTRGPK